jgi:DNA processing protein
LYYKGKLPSKKTMAIVGARAAGKYANQVTNHLVEGLASHGWVIVSGGAYGVDTMAHKKAVECKAPTVVVLGSGLLQPYPFSNKKLFDDAVLGGGAVISSFSLNTGPQRGNFPARNRIISGLSQGCIVVAAGQKSGSLITAQCALEEGRHVFAVPGPIDDPLSVGCHWLLGQGAKLVGSVNDVLEEFGGAIAHEKKNVFRTQSQNIPTKHSVVSAKRDTTGNPIVDALDMPRSLDDISSRTGESISELQFKLFDLQIEGKVKQNFAGLWERS